MTTRILFGIQARSTSERLTNKALKILHNKPMLSWVINACNDSAKYLTRKMGDSIHCDVVVLCPFADPIVKAFQDDVDIFQGEEHDVLSRYYQAADELKSDYIVRITGDCPLIQAYIISVHVSKALRNRMDYVSNVDPDIRTELDGRDCEVLSRRALDWLHDNARRDFDREHVTTYLRQIKPVHLKRAHVLNRLDVSDLKLSVDNEDDFFLVESKIKSFLDKKFAAEKDVGRDRVYCV